MIQIINIYNSKEENFEHNGLAVLDNCISCKVIEELNGLYELELEYPIYNNSKWEYLIEDNIIQVPTPTGNQLFRIYKTVKNMSGIVCYARHIFYDLAYNFLEDVRPTELDGNKALKYILNNTQYQNNFKSYSDIKETNTAYYIRKNPVQAIMGTDKNSFLNRWGGEIKRDNFNIFIGSTKNFNKGVVISYGKNLIGIEEDIDKSNICTRLMVSGLTDKDTLVMLDEKYVDSPNINKYPFPKIRHIHFQDIKIDIEKNITLEDVKKQLRKKAHELFYKDHIDIPRFNYKIDFVELSRTEEYKDYKCLEQVQLGDIITVRHNKLNLDIKQKVVSYNWDAISKKYINIELNSFKENLSDDFQDISREINTIKNNIDENHQGLITKLEKTDSNISAAVEKINENKAEIKISEERITSNVEDKIKDCNTKIEQTEESITSSVNNQISDCNSRIEQTSNNITSTVSRNFQDVNGKIRDCNSEIQQNANNISLVVRGGEIDGNALVSSINMSDKKIKMRALNIDLDGYVTFSNLENGETTIDGSCINTKTINANEIGSRMTEVSKFIYFDGSEGINGIGTKNSGRKEGWLWLYSSKGIIFDTDTVRFENGDRVATREWTKDFVDQRLEKFKEILDFLKK